MKAEFTDVLIIGAGPTGMALSIALHLRGVEHVLIDRLEQGQNTSRAASFTPRRSSRSARSAWRSG